MLGLVEGSVGPAQQGLVIRVAIEGGHANADGNLRGLVARQVESFCGHLGAQFFCGAAGTGQRGIHQQQQKLFAAQAEQVVAAARVVREQAGHLLQHHVARFVAVAVVDLLEVVDVDGQHGKAGAVAARVVHRFAQHHGQELAVEQAGEHVAPGFEFAVLLEQGVQVEGDVLAVLAQFAQLGDALAFAAGLGKGGQQHLVDALHGVQDGFCLAGALEGVRALVAKPQAKLRHAQARQLPRLQAHGVVEHELVFPVEQGGAAALTFGRDVLRHGKQAVGLFGARVAVARGGVGLAHDLHGQVDHLGDQLPGGSALRTIQAGIALEQGVHFFFQAAGAAQHQVDRHVDARMDFTDLVLLGHHGHEVVVRLQCKHAGHPGLHGGVQARVDLLVREVGAGHLVLHHLGVEVAGQQVAVCGGQGTHLLAHRRTVAVQQVAPFGGVLFVRVVGHAGGGGGRAIQTRGVQPSRKRVGAAQSKQKGPQPRKAASPRWAMARNSIHSRRQNGMSSSMSSNPEAARGGAAMGAGAGAMRGAGAAIGRGAAAGAARRGACS